MTGETLASRLAAVRQRVAAAAERSGRTASAITLVAVGKTHPASLLAEAVAAGAVDLGENRVQEAAAKRPLVSGATWHLIGPLQRNKVALALELFDVIQTVDRASLAARLERLLEERWLGRTLPVLLEVNLGEEPQKAGALPDEAANLAAAILAQPRLILRGLMAIPPFSVDPEASRPHFRRLRRLRGELEQRLGRSLPELSIGMSADFEVAIEEGATLVRVGTAIFGARG